MSNRNFDKQWTLGVRQDRLTFALFGAGTGNMTVADDPNKIVASCTRTGAGAYTLTLSSTLGFPNGYLQTFSVSLLMASPATNDFAVRSVSLGTNQTGASIQFTIYQGGSATDVALNDVAMFDITFRDGVR